MFSTILLVLSNCLTTNKRKGNDWKTDQHSNGKNEQECRHQIFIYIP